MFENRDEMNDEDADANMIRSANGLEEEQQQQRRSNNNNNSNNNSQSKSIFRSPNAEVCLTRSEYYGLIVALLALLLLAAMVAVIAGICYRRAKLIRGKNHIVDLNHPISSVVSGVSFRGKKENIGALYFFKTFCNNYSVCSRLQLKTC